MAYLFTAEKCGDYNVPILRQQLARCELIEFFPIEIRDDSLSLGFSIPSKLMDDPRFEAELVSVMTYLIADANFEVTDLYSGDPITANEIPGLTAKIYD